MDLIRFLDDCKTDRYAGIGSRSTPPDTLFLMTRIAQRLDRGGWTLRSGHAAGADTAFEDGSDRREIFLPWSGFNDHGPKSGAKWFHDPTSAALAIAQLHHPTWFGLKDSVRRLHARNVHQVLGANCDDPSAFVICWTPDGSTGITTSRTGGTGQALRIAYAYGIPIFNLQREDHRAAWERLVA